MNAYSNLEMNDEGTSCPMRKAKKKLREIEKLKLKPLKTSEEYAKISEEEVWKAIVEPVIVSTTPCVEEKNTKQLKRDKTKIKELEGKLRKEKESHILSKKQTESTLRKQAQEYDRRVLELTNTVFALKDQIRYLKSSKASYAKKSDSNPADELEEKVMEELRELSGELGNTRKAWKQLLLKYHPDKNKNSEISIQITKILSDIKV